MRRDWTNARAKIEHERCCRVCQSFELVEAAHTIGRKHDPYKGAFRQDEKIVRERDVVPLCRVHHVAYDRHELDLLPYLTHDEQAAAVEHVGIVSAMRRLTSTH